MFKQQARWHKLDNTANLFPVIANPRMANVFRLSAILKQEIQPALLQQAVCDILPFFSAFYVRLRHGLFWSYLEQNDLPFQISQETQAPCRYIDPQETSRYLFRVLYFHNRISLETFHALTDGIGALRFLKAICYRYCQLASPNAFSHENLQQFYGLEESQNVCDGYLKNYIPQKRTRAFREPTAFHIRGEKRLSFDLGIRTILCSVSELKEVCAKHQCSISEYFTAAILYAVYEEYMPIRGSKRPVSVFVPVNLRPIFQTDTSTNFFSGISVCHYFTQNTSRFDELLSSVNKQFIAQVTKEYFAEKLAYTARSEIHFFTRIIPLPLKREILKMIFEHSNHGSSITLSNLGPVQVEPEFAAFFEGFRFLLSTTQQEPIKCSVVSFGDTLALTICSELQDSSLAKNIVRRLSSAGISVQIESGEITK